MHNAHDPNSFDRDKLYEDVWAATMTVVSKKYGVSRIALRRICDSFQVPTPPPGHWRRIHLGCHIEPPALPPMLPRWAEASIFAAKTGPADVTHFDDKPSSALERHIANVASVTSFGRMGWRHAIDDLRHQMESEVARARALKKGREWEESHPGNRYQPSLDSAYGSWERFCDAGQLLFTTTHRKVVARLSVNSYKRGLSMLKAICRQAERKGYLVEMAHDYERLRLSKDRASVELRINEKLTKGTRYRINEWDKSCEPVRTLTPTGKLALFIEQQGRGHTELVDLPNQLLENQFDKVLAAIDDRHRASVRWAAERAERERRSRVDAIRREQENRQQMEQLRKAEEEDRRRQALISEIENWRQAQLIHSYLRSLQNRLSTGGHPAESYGAWREWALTVAADLDPTCRRINFLETRDPGL